jgi:hypothetical protein
MWQGVVWRFIPAMLLFILVAASVILCIFWPLRRAQVLKQLQEASQSKVQFADFHGTYFPRPGCLLEKVTFRLTSGQDSPPFITVERLRIEGSFFGLLSKHVRLIKVEGMRILVPPKGSADAFKTPQRSSIVIDDLVANEAILEFASLTPKDPSLKFYFRRFDLNAIGSSSPASFHADFVNPEPLGEIVTNGKFGPWNADGVGKTAVSGEYIFEKANLGVFGGIAGMLSSSGKFNGTLNHIAVEGDTDVPNFTVTSSEHPVPLKTNFQAVVDATTGDTFLNNVNAKFGTTTVSSRGSFTVEEQGKIASIDFAAREGKIEDLLRLFSKETKPSMSGEVTFFAKALLPSGKQPFLEKVQLHGDFGVDGGTFNEKTQEEVDNLSRSAQGMTDRLATDKELRDSGSVLTNLKGHVVVQYGTAHFSNLSFKIPGAIARLHGSYDLVSEKIDLHGTLTTDSKPSSAVHGVKTLLLKVLDPLFKNHNRTDYTAPVQVTGTYAHPLFGLDLGVREHRK